MISKFTSKFGKLLVYYKKYGFTGFSRHILVDSIYYGKFEIFEGDLSKPIEEIHAKIPINIKALSVNEAEIDRLVQFWPDTYAPPFSTPERIKELIIHRLSVGEECLIIEHDGEIIFMEWIGFQNTHIFNPYAQKKGIGADEILGYNAYCAAMYRGNNIMGAVRNEIYNIFKMKGYKKFISYVQHDNYASKKVNIKFCGKAVQKLRILNILGFRTCFLSKRLG